MTDDLYYRKLESTSTTDLVDMIRDKDKQIAELEEQIEQLTFLHNEDVNTIKLLNKQIKEIKENG